MDVPRLNPICKELIIHRRFDRHAVASKERHEPPTITHSVHINQILVSPMPAERDGIAESMIPLERRPATKVVIFQ